MRLSFGMAGAGSVHARRELPAALGVENQHVGLHRLDAALARLARRGLEVVERAHRRLVDHLAVEHVGAARAQHAAARPVDRHAVAHRAAEQFVDRHAERLALDVEAGVLDRRDRVGVQSACGRARGGVERRVDPPDVARVLADQSCSEPADDLRHAAAAAFVELRPADDAFVGGDLQERIGVPAAVGVEVLELDDFHGLPCVRGRW